MNLPHPVQPLYKDEHGAQRFKKNAIIEYLLDNGGLDLNKLAVLPFSDEDREQFAQLIGYSLSGFGELSYVSDETFNRAARQVEEGIYDKPTIDLITELTAALERTSYPDLKLVKRGVDWVQNAK